MTRVFPLPAPARIRTGPSVVSTASRCCGFSCSRKDNADVAPESLIQFYRGIAADGMRSNSRPQISETEHPNPAPHEFYSQADSTLSFFSRVERDDVPTAPLA